MNLSSLMQVLAVIQKQIAEGGDVGASQIVRVPDLAAAIGVAPSATVPTEQAAPPLTWNEPGWAIGMVAQERSGAVGQFAKLELKLLFNGTRSLITAGNAGPASYPILSLLSTQLRPFKLLRRVAKNDIWQVTYRNFDTVNTAFPTVGFPFLSDADIARMIEE